MAGAPHLLVGFAESLAAPESVWSLADAGFRLTAFTRRGARAPIRRFRPLEVVEVDSPGDDWRACLGQIAELARAVDADALMPFDDEALWLCARHAEEHDLPVIGATGLQARLALDKRVQFTEAAAAGFSLPPTVVLDSIEDLDRLPEFPLVVKRALAVSERDGAFLRAPTVVCADRHELDRALATYPVGEPVVLQRWLRGTGEGLFGLMVGTDLVAASAHRRIRMVDPHGSGSSACVSIPIDSHVAAAAKALLARSGWRGLFMIETLRADDRTWFVELNGRPWGSTALARRLGNEYPAWAARERLFDTAPPVRSTDFREIVCRHLGFEIAHTLAVLKGPRSRALSFPSRRRTIADVARIRRSDTWYNLRPGCRGVFLEDTLQTGFAPVLRRLRR